MWRLYQWQTERPQVPPNWMTHDESVKYKIRISRYNQRSTRSSISPHRLKVKGEGGHVKREIFQTKYRTRWSLKRRCMTFYSRSTQSSTLGTCYGFYSQSVHSASGRRAVEGVGGSLTEGTRELCELFVVMPPATRFGHLAMRNT